MSEDSKGSARSVVTGMAWVVAILAIVAATFISMNSNKLPATMSLVISALRLDASAASGIMALNGVVGLILAIPAAGIIMKYGTKLTTAVVLICAVVGAIISAVATDYMTLVIGRLIEGVGYACIGTVIPVLISEWFPAEKRGLPMGIFSCWVPFGSLLILSTSGFFINSAVPTSYHNVFWFVVVLLAIITVVWIVAVRKPTHSFIEAVEGAEQPRLSEGFKSATCWIVALGFAAFSLGTACLMNFETLYLVQVQNMTQVAANGMVSWLTIGMLAGGVIIGVVMGFVKSTKGRLYLLLVCALVLAVCFGFAYSIGGAVLVPYMLICGFVDGAVPAILFTMVPEIAPRPALSSVASTLMSLGQCVGGILFFLVGTIITAAGWGATTGLLFVVGFVCFASMVVLMLLMKRRRSTDKDPDEQREN